MKLFLIFLLSSVLLYASEEQNIQSNLDLVWIMVATALVFFMQAGFTFVETGVVRAKNSINVAMKNVVDMIFAITTYFFVGFGVMFGVTYGGLFGTSGFLLDGFSSNFDYTFFIFQAVFAGTSVTIVSGAIAERMQFKAYLVIAVFVSAIIYPVVGHWGWGGAILEGETGWLAEKGFIDFAGSTIVHSVGAWVGLAGAIVLGARIDRFDKDGKPNEMQPFSQTYIALGVFILWFGWFGFNGGSTLAGDGSFAKVIVVTSISASVAGIVSLFISIYFYGKPYVEKVLFGILAGLVGITAGCGVIDPLGAIVVGATSSIVMHLGEEFLLKLKIDDPVAAVPVHGFTGAWGTLIIPFVASTEHLVNNSRLDQFIIQLQGVVVVFLWCFLFALIIFTIFNKLDLLRVPIKDEEIGLNISEHGAKMEWNDTIDTIKNIITSENYSHRCEVTQSGTEVSVIARNFNVLLEHVTKKMEDDNNFINEVAKLAYSIKSGDLTNRIDTQTNNEQLQELKDVLNDMLDDMENNIGRDINEIVAVMESFVHHDYTKSISQTHGKIETSINKLGVDTSKMLEKNITNGLQLQKDANILDTNVQYLTDTTNKQALNITEAISQVNEISQNIKDNSNKAISMNSYAGDLESSATKGHSLASNTATAMEEIYDATQTINQAIETIESISFQTNILSLNAAVEAATAGEAGKGFAVVAQEVRNLASRSSESASQIRSLVETAQEKTLQGKKISSEMIDGYNQLNEKISKTSTLIDEVANGSDKQLLGIEYINKIIFDFEKMLKNNQSITKETNDIATRALQLANVLVEDVANKKYLEKKAS